jgi:hypothetical protein
MSIIFKICQGLIETNKSQHNHLINRLIRLILTLHVFTATKNRAFSAMKHVQNMSHNKMKGELLTYFMMIYIEQELAEDICKPSRRKIIN